MFNGGTVRITITMLLLLLLLITIATKNIIMILLNYCHTEYAYIQ